MIIPVGWISSDTDYVRIPELCLDTRKKGHDGKSEGCNGAAALCELSLHRREGRLHPSEMTKGIQLLQPPTLETWGATTRASAFERHPVPASRKAAMQLVSIAYTPPWNRPLEEAAVALEERKQILSLHRVLSLPLVLE
ncbi:uncharacterized protein LOC144136683 isoform X2 [Amblyomma americanum]